MALAFVWEWMTDALLWKPFPSSLSQAIESSFQAHHSSLNLCISSSSAPSHSITFQSLSACQVLLFSPLLCFSATISSVSNSALLLLSVVRDPTRCFIFRDAASVLHLAFSTAFTCRRGPSRLHRISFSGFPGLTISLLLRLCDRKIGVPDAPGQ